jgi:hypothetical protein
MKKRKKYATGGLVDYSQENPLASFLEFDSKPIVEEETPNNESIFGDDFLGFSRIGQTPLEDGESDENAVVPRLSSSGIDNFLSERESGGNYGAMSPNSSATGKYQFIWSIHKDKIKKLTGIDSQEAFLKSPEAQEAYYNYYKESELIPAIKKFSAIKNDLVGITDEQIMAAYHFAGPGNLAKAIKNKTYNQPLDANGTSIMSYIAPKSNMKKKKFDLGGVAMGVGQGVSSLAPALLSILDEAGKGYATQPIVAQQQSQAFNPLSRQFEFALGGIAPEVPIEAEGNEMIETPDGSVGEIKGPSHEQGGVDMQVPGGTKIYSDRIAIDGRTMSDRKKARTKMVERLEKLLTKTPTDKLLRNTLKRTQEVLNKEEAKDMMIQQAAGIGTPPIEDTGEVPQFDRGGIVPLSNYSYSSTVNPTFAQRNPLLPDIDVGGNELGIGDEVLGLGEAVTLNVPSTMQTPLSFSPLTEQSLLSNTFNANSVGTQGEKGGRSAGGLTLGDGIGMAGNLFNAFAPLLNTMRNAEATRPNENFYSEFGRDALDANQQAQDYVAGMRENALTRVAQQANASKANNRNSASSLNTIRALDLATDLGINTSRNQVYDSSSQNMINLLGQKAQLENMQDQVVMGGEQARDLANRQDMDNVFSNLAENYTNLGTNIQGLGKNLNTSQGNKDMLDIMEQLSKYGLGWQRDSKGRLKLNTK